MVETIAVLIVFMFLVFLGYSFYAGIQQRSFNTQLREIRAKEAVQISLKTYFLPELHCSFGTRLEAQGCIDVLKYYELKNLIEDNDNVKQFYFQIFGNSNISLIQNYPMTSFYLGDQGWVPLSPDIPGSTIDLFSSALPDVSSRVTQMPVTIYDPRTKQHAFGYLQVDYTFQG